MPGEKLAKFRGEIARAILGMERCGNQKTFRVRGLASEDAIAPKNLL